MHLQLQLCSRGGRCGLGSGLAGGMTDAGNTDDRVCLPRHRNPAALNSTCFPVWHNWEDMISARMQKVSLPMQCTWRCVTAACELNTVWSALKPKMSQEMTDSADSVMKLLQLLTDSANSSVPSDRDPFAVRALSISCLLTAKWHS